MELSNLWNKIRYTLYLPFYDLIAGVFSKERKRSIEILNPDKEDKVLIVGAGTGLDLEFLQGLKKIVAIDITPGMINKLEKKASKLNLEVEAFVMDGQSLEFQKNNFDCVILHLILAVIPDPYQCLKEVERVLKPGGKVVVLDKFLPDNEQPSFIRKIINSFTGFLFSEINRKFSEILKVTSLKKELDIPVKLKGAFRIIKLKKEF